MFEIDRWRNWQPEKFGIYAEYELPKLPKVSFVGFGSSIPRNIQNFLDDLRPPLVAWCDARIRLDPRWSTSMNALYADFCAWMFDRDLAPSTSMQFRHLLEELCFEIRDVAGEHLVSNVAFKEDVLVPWYPQFPPQF